MYSPKTRSISDFIWLNRSNGDHSVKPRSFTGAGADVVPLVLVEVDINASLQGAGAVRTGIEGQGSLHAHWRYRRLESAHRRVRASDLSLWIPWRRRARSSFCNVAQDCSVGVRHGRGWLGQTPHLLFAKEQRSCRQPYWPGIQWSGTDTTRCWNTTSYSRAASFTLRAISRLMAAGNARPAFTFGTQDT